MNSITTGITARRVVIPGEDLEDHRAQVDAWVGTFRPATPGEAILASRIADAFKRLDRLDRQAETLHEAGVLAALDQLPVSKNLQRLEEARSAVRAMAETFRSIPTKIPTEALQQLLPAMRFVLAQAEEVDVPMALLIPLKNAVNDLVFDGMVDLGASGVAHVAAAVLPVDAHLDAAWTTAHREVLQERERLMSDPTLGDEEHLRRLDRFRSRTLREIDGLLRTLQQVRELARSSAGDSGSLVRVELRLVGPRGLAQR